MTSVLAYYGGKSGNFLLPASRDRWDSRYQAARKSVVLDRMTRQQSMDPNEIEKATVSLALKGLIIESVSAGVGPVVTANVDDSRITEIRTSLTKLQNQYGQADGTVRMAKILDETYGINTGSALLSDINTGTSSNKLGLVGNTNTLRNVTKNNALVSEADLYYKDSPFIGQLLNETSEGNYYSQIANDTLYGVQINGEPLKARYNDPAQIARQSQYSAGWNLYFTSKEYIEADAKANNIKPGTAQYKAYYGVWKTNLKAAIAEKYPLWGERPQTLTLGQSDEYVKIAKMFLNDKQFMSTVGKTKAGEINGLKAYIEARDVIIQELNANRAATGTMGLDTNANRYYLEWSQNTGQAIVEAYPEFKRMYEYYFIDDELNDVGPVNMKDGN